MACIAGGTTAGSARSDFACHDFAAYVFATATVAATFVDTAAASTGRCRFSGATESRTVESFEQRTGLPAERPAFSGTSDPLISTTGIANIRRRAGPFTHVGSTTSVTAHQAFLELVHAIKGSVRNNIPTCPVAVVAGFCTTAGATAHRSATSHREHRNYQA